MKSSYATTIYVSELMTIQIGLCFEHFETLLARVRSLIVCSLGLEDKECLVNVAEQVKEHNVTRLVCDR